jgi:hypothetical protein
MKLGRKKIIKAMDVSLGGTTPGKLLISLVKTYTG